MAADDVSETRELAAPIPQRRRTLIGRISQLWLAVFYFAAGTILTILLLSTETVTSRRRVLLAGLIGLMLLLTFIHLVVFCLGSIGPNGVPRARTNRPQRIA
jgi:hypothetical protein